VFVACILFFVDIGKELQSYKQCAEILWRISFSVLWIQI